ncbi:MAG: hypothetical protein NVS9B1_06450 [Candidatus Dormibacteraceae bacterium]
MKVITRERERTETGGGSEPPPPPPDRGREWWREWPAPFNRPRPVNRRTFRRGAMIAVPALLLVDGLLGAMAFYATRNIWVALGVFAFVFTFTLLELALVAWATKKRQDLERRRAG